MYSSVRQCVTVCCSVLQCVAACCSRSFRGGVGGQVSVHVTVRSSVLQYLTVCCRVLQPHLPWRRRRPSFSTCHSVIQCVAVCYSVLQCVAECCSRTFRGGVGGQVSQDPQHQARKSERLSHTHSHPAGSKKKNQKSLGSHCTRIINWRRGGLGCKPRNQRIQEGRGVVGCVGIAGTRIPYFIER